MAKLIIKMLAFLSMFYSGIVFGNNFQIRQVAKPLFQKINLRLDPNLESFSGSTVIELEVLKKTKVIEVSGKDYKVISAAITGAKNCKLTGDFVVESKFEFRCQEFLNPGKYKLEVQFNAPYNRHSVGLYKTMVGKKPFLFTQFESVDARRVFPVFDEPKYKIPFQLVVETPSSQKVYANTPKVKEEISKDWTIYTFAKTKPLPSYLLAFAVGDLEEKNIEGLSVPGKLLTVNGRMHLSSFVHKEIPGILKALEEYFGIPYPYAKLDTVAVPEFPYGAMENAGLITYKEATLLFDEENATIDTKQRTVNVLAHELAHQWYGNLVTMEWWNDLWLNEAFATWMAAKITDQLHPEYLSKNYLSQNRAMGTDARISTKPIRKKSIDTQRDIGDGMGLAYSKGSAVLTMIENWIGEEAFRKGVRQYLNDHTFKNAVASDLWGALSKASGKDVEAVLKSFMEQSSFPLLTVSLKEKNIEISQQRYFYHSDKGEKQLWKVPVVIKYGIGNQVYTKSFLLSETHKVVTLDIVPEWVYPDQNAFGYYRWMMKDHGNDGMVQRSIPHLNTREKLAYISGLESLIEAGELDLDVYLSQVEKFLADDQPRIVSNAWNNITVMEYVFVDKSNEEKWNSYIAPHAKKLLEKIGFESQTSDSNDVRKFRSDLIFDLAMTGKDTSLQKKALEITGKYLEGKTVDSYTLGSFLKIAAYYGDKFLFERLQKEFETTNEPEKRTKILEVLGFFNDKIIQFRSLDYVLSDQINATDLYSIFGSNAYKHSRLKTTQEWIFKNYDQVKLKMNKNSRGYLFSLVSGNCDSANLAIAEKFFAPKQKEIEGYERTLEKNRESIESCVKFKNREQVKFGQFLKEKTAAKYL